jgi:hypothetical protein
MKRTFVRRVGAPAVLALALCSGAGAMTASSASASTSDSVLRAATSAGGTCSYDSNVSWTRSTDLLYTYLWVKDSARTSACRKRGVVTFHDSGGYGLGSVSFDAATACGTWDPTCASTVSRTVTVQGGVPSYLRPYVSYVTLQVVDR